MLGQPVSVVSSFRNVTGKAVEDDALCVLEFACGACALVETSLVAPYNPQIMEVYGTKGSILCVDGSLTMQTAETDGRIAPAMPVPLPSPIRQFTDSVLYQKPVLYGLEEARTLSRMMQNAYNAYRSGQKVLFR